jgi:hypothetical protein
MKNNKTLVFKSILYLIIVSSLFSFEKIDPPNTFAFVNVIKQEGQCNMGGKFDYLTNSDKNNKYDVTIRTSWRQGINKGESDSIEKMNAGEKRSLGCTNDGQVPTTYYTRKVVGETKK